MSLRFYNWTFILDPLTWTFLVSIKGTGAKTGYIMLQHFRLQFIWCILLFTNTWVNKLVTFEEMLPMKYFWPWLSPDFGTQAPTDQSSLHEWHGTCTPHTLCLALGKAPYHDCQAQMPYGSTRVSGQVTHFEWNQLKSRWDTSKTKKQFSYLIDGVGTINVFE